MITDLNSFFNNYELKYISLIELKSEFWATPFRLTEDNKYIIQDNDENFNFCPGEVKLHPITNNKFSFDSYLEYSNVKFETFEVEYSCKRIANSKAMLYVAFLMHSDGNSLFLLTTDVVTYDLVLLNLSLTD